MDPSDLSPTALFSPSKARAQLAQAQDWHHVNTWLSTHYRGASNRIPPFERNEATLKALLDLAAANERADEEVELVAGVKREALEDVRRLMEVRIVVSLYFF